MSFTAGDPGEQSAADQGQSAAVDAATAGANAGSIGGFDGGGNNNSTGTMDPGQMQAAGFNTEYGFVAQDAYNTAHGITETNPYGKHGFFSRVFGIDPKNISYVNNMSLATRQAIANNQFSKFANPQNIPGQIGYNPAFPTAEKGKLRPGAQKAGFETQYGTVMEQYAEQSTPDMIARGIMGLLGGPIGLGLSQIGTQEYGLPGQPGFESFDPNNPRGPQSIAGKIASAFTGGIDPTQAAAKAAATANAISDYFSSKPSAPTQVQSVAQQAPVQGFEEAKSRSRPSTDFSRPDVNLSISKSQGIADFFSSPTTENPVPGMSKFDQNMQAIQQSQQNQDFYADLIESMPYKGGTNPLGFAP